MGQTIFYKLHEFSNYSLSTDVSDDELLNLAYKQNPYVSMVVNRIASTASYLKQFNDHPLFTQPIKAAIYTNLLVFGNAYVYMLKPVGVNGIREVKVLVNPNLQVIYNEGESFKTVKEYKYMTQTYTPDEVLHIMLPNPTSVYPRGLSKLQAGQTTYTASNFINQYELNTYKNRGVSGLISGVGDMPITPKENEQLQIQFQEETAGVENANKIKIVAGEVKYTAIGLRPVDMLSTDSDLQKLRTICSLYDVDSTLFNDKAASTYNNMKEAMAAFYTLAVLPLADMVNQSISAFLLETEEITEEQIISVDYADIDALRKDATLDATVKQTNATTRKAFLETLRMEMEMGLLSQDEARAKMKEFDLLLFGENMCK
jgi:HK97 family phage portal protein